MPVKLDFTRLHPSVWAGAQLNKQLIEVARERFRQPEWPYLTDEQRKEVIDAHDGAWAEITLLCGKVHCAMLDTDELEGNCTEEEVFASALAWCEANFGDDNQRWTALQTEYGRQALYFRDEEDMSIFLAIKGGDAWSHFGWHRDD